MLISNFFSVFSTSLWYNSNAADVIFGTKFILLLLTVGTLSLILNGAVPLALSLVSPQRAGLAAGTYFAGAALGGSLFLVIFPNLANVSPVREVFIGTVALQQVVLLISNALA